MQFNSRIGFLPNLDICAIAYCFLICSKSLFLEAEEVKKLKSRVSALEGTSSSMTAHTSRLSARNGDIGINKETGSKAEYVNSLDSAVYSDNSALQRNVQQILRAELQSEAMKGTCEHSSA